MKKFLLPTLGLLAFTLTPQAQAQYFFQTNLVLVQQGTLPSTGLGVSILQMQTNGTLVSSTNLPTSGSTSFILSTSTTEGFVTLSANSNYLVLGGYNALPGSSPSAATSAAAPRAVVTLDAYGNYAMPISNPNIYSTFNIRGAVSDGLGNFWTSGSGGTGATIANGELGIIYVGTATQPANVCVAETGTGNERCLEIYNGNLFVGTGSVSNGVFLISNVAGAYPKITTSAANAGVSNVLIEATSSSPYAFQINAANTVAYLAEDTRGGIVKYTGVNGLWTSNYTLPVITTGVTPSSSTTNAYGCAVDWSQSPPVIYATTGESQSNRLVRIIDTGSSATASFIAKAPASNVWRGVRFGPGAYPSITVQPVPFLGNPGVTATFSATVVLIPGSPAASYQWYSNSVANPTYVAIPGATATNLSVPNITTSQSGSLFYLVVSNSFGAVQSTAASLTVQDPAITVEPMGATNFPGSGPVTLCVTASGTGTLTYQWLSNGVPILPLTSSQSSCYTVPNSAATNSALYSVIVSNSLGGFVTSSATTVAYSIYLLDDTFAYPNGNLFTDAGTQWKEVSGSSPIRTTNDRVLISESNAVPGTAIGLDLFSQPQSEGTYVWASFTINLTTVPTTPGGVYFGSFADTNFDFFAKLYVLTSNNPAYTPDIPNVAYPGTYRIGVANYLGPNAVVELDMAPGIDYNVVVYYGVGGFAQVSVNPSPSEFAQSFYPSGPNPLTSGYASDTYTYTSENMSAFELHETAAVGIFELANLEVSYDWNGGGSGFAAVTANFTTNLPVIGLQPVGFTNYLGNTGILEAAASGIDLTYQWYLNGNALMDTTNFAGSESNALVFSYLSAASAGTYTCVVSNEAGPVTSSSAVVSVVTTPTAPIFTVQPVSTTNSLGGTAVFTASAVGTGPISYEWFLSPSTDTGVSGPTLTLPHLTTNYSGNVYYVVATGGTGLTSTSSNATLTVNGPIVTNIAFLRSLQNTNMAPTITVPATSSVQVYQVTGTVMEYTNIESATYAEYWIQDSTAGIEFFVIDPTFRPHLGDLVTVSGVVDIYSDALELDGSANNPAEPYTITSTNGEGLPLPYPAELIPFGFSTANPGLSSLVYQGKLATFTNCYFTTANGTNAFTGNADLTVTNNTGQSYGLYIAQSAGPDLAGTIIPPFAYSITGEFDQFDTTYELNLSAGFQIVTNPPPPVSNLVAKLTGSSVTLTWPVTVVPNTTSSAYTYSVWSTTNLLVPFTPLAPGLWFASSNGTYSIPISTNAASAFYEIVSP